MAPGVTWRGCCGVPAVPPPGGWATPVVSNPGGTSEPGLRLPPKVPGLPRPCLLEAPCVRSGSGASGSEPPGCPMGPRWGQGRMAVPPGLHRPHPLGRHRTLPRRGSRQLILVEDAPLATSPISWAASGPRFRLRPLSSPASDAHAPVALRQADLPPHGHGHPREGPYCGRHSSGPHAAR